MHHECEIKYMPYSFRNNPEYIKLIKFDDDELNNVEYIGDDVKFNTIIIR